MRLLQGAVQVTGQFDTNAVEFDHQGPDMLKLMVYSEFISKQNLNSVRMI